MKKIASSSLILLAKSHVIKRKQFILYSFIGLSGVALDFAVYLGLVSTGLPPFIASMISVSFGIINNFFWNAFYNFKRRDHLLMRFLSFYAIGAVGVVLSALIIILLHNIIGMDDIIAKVLSVPFVVVFQYWFNKNASFAENSSLIPWRAMSITLVSILTLFIFAVNAPYFNFTDENDNLLGAQLIVEEGAVIYKDYFSHHMPLTYFVAAPLMALFDANLIAVKVVFGILMGIWLLFMSRHLLIRFNMLFFTSFVLLVAISQMLSWSHMILAETLIAFSLSHAIILFITRGTSRNFTREGITYALLGSIPILSSLSYVPISIFIYCLFALRIFERRNELKSRQLLAFVPALAIPYAVLLTYFYVTKSFSEFIQQALHFNTLYYSQFTPNAPQSALEALLLVPTGAFESLYRALSTTLASQPISFLFASSLLLALGVIISLKKWVIAVVFSIGLLLGASRYGFSAVFADGQEARAGIIVSLVGILLLTYVISVLLSGKNISKDNIPAPLFSLSSIVIGITLVFLSISSLAKVGETAINYTKGTGTLSITEEPGSPSTVINLVNAPTDSYWLGPIDFSSQIITESSNVSSYRFYAPWHAVCSSCTTQLISDIQTGNPRVIALNENMEVWNEPVGEYAEVLIDSFEDNYYQVADVRLEQFFFRISDKEEINLKLKKAGYEL